MTMKFCGKITFYYISSSLRDSLQRALDGRRAPPQRRTAPRSNAYPSQHCGAGGPVARWGRSRREAQSATRSARGWGVFDTVTAGTTGTCAEGEDYTSSVPRLFNSDDISSGSEIRGVKITLLVLHSTRNFYIHC